MSILLVYSNVLLILKLKLSPYNFFVLDENNFAGSFPTGVCLPIQAKSGTVSSDCFGAPPKINCELFTCCNLCYPLWQQKGDNIDGEALDDQSGSSVSLSSDGTVMAIGAPGNYLSNDFSYSGRVRVYKWNANTLPQSWEQMGDGIDGEAAADKSGWSVSLSSDGTAVAIGARGNDDNGTDSGHVRVYKWNETSSSWVQTGADIDGEAAGDEFGTSVSLSGDGNVVAIGAPYNDGTGTSSGHVRVYEFSS